MTALNKLTHELPFAFLLIAIVASLTSITSAQQISIDSPDGKISTTWEIKDGAITYAISRSGNPIVESSTVEVFAGGKVSLVEHSQKENDTRWNPVWGQFSTIRDHHRELTLSLNANGVPVKLLCRAFDTGVGFRFVLDEQSAGKKISFTNEYNLLQGKAHYSGQRGHKVGKDRPVRRPKKGIKQPPATARAPRADVPLVTERTDGLHLGFLESDLYSAAGFGLMNIKTTGTSFKASSSAVSIGGGQMTAWRTILIGETAGDLTINTIPLNLSAPCKLSDTSWIKSGKGLWDWRVHGYDNGDFTYGIDDRSYYRYIDFCADNGIEFFTIDDHWFEKAGDGKMEVSPAVDIEKVIRYAKNKGVAIMLYYDRKKGNFGDETLFGHYADLGAAGMKYGFMGNKADFTRASMDAAAEKKLLINFHDGPSPMAGVERTLPNLITREYCHGQQDSRSAFTPETFLRMATVSTLSGPLDMSNGNFGLNGINAGEREKGPKRKNSYISTVTSEVARNLVIYTGLVTLPDAPEEYLKKMDLFEFLKQMPTTWDESRVPNSKIGTYITVARRSGDAWFVGSVNDQSKRSLNISLDFLEQGKTYAATIYQDTPDSHGLKNSEAYNITTSTVKHGDVITAQMAAGGGHAMILRPAP